MMDPPQDYGEQLVVPEAEYPPGYQPIVLIPTYPLQELIDAAAKDFFISFKSNEKNVKNPVQVVADDVLYCMKNKHVCVYLGQRLYPFDGHAPRVLVYLKYKDDKYKNEKVVPCDEHCKNLTNPYHLLQSDNVDVMYENSASAYILNFAYPQAVGEEDSPSISFRFVCSSSCFKRSHFELHLDLVIPGLYNNGGPIIASRRHLVKVCANPGRDSGQQSNVANAFVRAKAAFTVGSQKPRARKVTDGSDGGPCSKRSVSDSGQVHFQNVGIDRVEREKAANGVYYLPVYGFEDFKKLNSHYDMMLTKDKYTLSKCPGRQSRVFNSQIRASADLDDWLESLRMRKYKDLLKANDISTMDQLHRAYHIHLFESLQIPLEDAKTLHCSFIYWRTKYLTKIFENAENILE